ncbi:hypothetical protein COO60DRAFT_211458 [Scenedesmus sp. NREL 46B-D3]|nr:hypothetical protein COO60DRAFT_211458 [Scenedesmus sp. NREL 46B-D3]
MLVDMCVGFVCLWCGRPAQAVCCADAVVVSALQVAVVSIYQTRSSYGAACCECAFLACCCRRLCHHAVLSGSGTVVCVGHEAYTKCVCAVSHDCLRDATVVWPVCVVDAVCAGSSSFQCVWHALQSLTASM